MSPLRVARRAALVIGGILVVAALVLSVVGVSLVRRSFPQTEGEITVPGLAAKVDVLRDERGIPQIYGDSLTDIAKAQGFVHAQDRFFEMDLRRHVTSGRLSEPRRRGRPRDRQGRPHDGLATRRRGGASRRSTRRPARRSRRTRTASTPTCVVARRRRHRSSTSSSAPRSTTTRSRSGRRPTPSRGSRRWRGTCAATTPTSLARARLSTRVTGAQIADLFPPYDVANTPILAPDQWAPRSTPGQVSSSIPAALRSSATRASAREVADAIGSASAQDAYAAVGRALAAVPALMGRGEGIGSNSWVVGPQKSATGKPLLANDPHLAPGIPGIWYQVGLHCREKSEQCPLDVAGFSFSGVPGVVIGHNDKIAWGFTNLDPDVSDFYLEKIDGNRVQRGATFEPLQTRREVIKVAGQPDETITVRSTRHGPIMSDVLPALDDAGERSPVPPVEGQATAGQQDFAVSMAWTGLQPAKTADAIFALNVAQDFTEFRQAAKALRGPRAEPHLRRRRRPHRLPGAGPGAGAGLGLQGCAARLLAGAGLGRDLRLAGVRAVRLHAVRARPRRGLHRHRQPGRDGEPDTLPHDRVGLRLPLAAHP